MKSVPFNARAWFSVTFAVLGLQSALAEDPAPIASPTPAAVASSAITGPQVAVFSIAMSTSESQQGTAATATVTVLNRAGRPIAGARVTGTWSGLTTTRGSALTNAQGRATFHSARVKDKGTFIFDVGTVNAMDATYNAALNAKSHDSIATLGVAAPSHLTLGTSASPSP